jgi:hypothetical protein
MNMPTITDIKQLNPPEQGFFSKVLDCHGIPIKSHADVSDEALVAAANRIWSQMENQPGILYNMAQSGAQLHVIGKDQVTSDLPYMRHMRGIICDKERNQNIDERTRGVGGLNASCGEENVLMLENDRYIGRDICRHEFAHTILDYGMDPATRQLIIDRYHEALKEGLWETCYSATHFHEYWAELTMWYFDFRGDLGKKEPQPQPGVEWFKNYDPKGYELIDSIYTGKLQVGKVDKPILAPISPDKEPEIRSEISEKPTMIIFDNPTEIDFQIFKLDENGERQNPHTEHEHSATLHAGNRDGHETFAGSAWIVVDMQGKALGIYIAQEQPRKVILGS